MGNKVDAFFAPSKRGTIGFIRFGAPDSMWGFMRSRAGLPRPSYKDARLWVSVERTKLEREMASRCSRAMRTIRSLLVPSAEQASVPDFVDVDYRRAIVWVRQLRVCQWAATTGSWEVRADEVTTLCTAGVWTARPSELANLLNTV